jgi:tetratricopeptide (TPR) repeat protein
MDPTAESDPVRPTRPVQLSLFPEAAEVQATALAALRDLDVAGARVVVDRLRRRSPALVNLAVIDETLRLLERHLGPGPATPHQLAELVSVVRLEAEAGRLSSAAADFADETVARYWRAHPAPSASPFLDSAERIHRGVLDLVLGNAAAARDHLRTTLDAGHGHRADLWAYRGDACVVLQRTAEAHACYTRALLLDPCAVDLQRCRMRPLVDRFTALRERHPEEVARELLLVELWLAGLLSIPAPNTWLSADANARRPAPKSEAVAKYRRFAWLLYLDRSRPPDAVDLARREEMAELDPSLFTRYMQACREREAGRLP